MTTTSWSNAARTRIKVERYDPAIIFHIIIFPVAFADIPCPFQAKQKQEPECQHDGLFDVFTLSALLTVEPAIRIAYLRLSYAAVIESIHFNVG